MRKQHLFLLLSMICLVLLVWFPIWEYHISLAGMDQKPVNIELTATALTVHSPEKTPAAIPEVSPSFWYLNTAGVLLNLIILLVAFLHFGDLKIQKRWGFLALVSAGTSMIFSFLQINIIIGQYSTMLQSDLGIAGKFTIGELIFESAPSQSGLILIAISITFVLLAIWSINQDMKLIASMNRLR